MTRIDASQFLTNSTAARWGSALAEKGGFVVTRLDNSLKAKRMAVLRGLDVTVVLDIGANAGQWARELRSSGYSGKIISFEPAPEPFQELETLAQADGRHTCVQVGLGKVDGKAELLVTRASQSSSFRDPVGHSGASRHTGIDERVTVPIRRLDSLLPSLTEDTDRFYVKIDTQGFEREVLAGAEDTLSRADAVEIEMSLVELYDGQALLPELWQVLTLAGFRPAWLERGYRDINDIWLLQIDGLFVREQAWAGRRT